MGEQERRPTGKSSVGVKGKAIPKQGHKNQNSLSPKF
jgi:hypothetical protein